MRLGICCLTAAIVWAGVAWGDEIVFGDGTSVFGEIFRETDYYVYYVDPVKDCCCTVSKKEVKQVKHALEPMVDLKAFLKRAEKKISFREKADLETVLAAIEKFGRDKPKRGVKIVVNADLDAPELIVDPFPEEDQIKPAAKKPKETPQKQESKPPEKKPAEAAPDKAPAEEGAAEGD